MKKFLGGALALLLVFPGVLSADTTADQTKLESYDDKLSYSIGMDIGKNIDTNIKNMKKSLSDDMQVQINLEALTKGLNDVLNGADSILTPEENTAVMEQFQAKVQALQEAKMIEMREANAVAATAFLEANKKKPGVKVTESGLQYEVLKEGSGKNPANSDMVTVDYVGTLINGTEFDSSIKRGEPVKFPVNGVIPGWTEALQLMNVGAKYKLVIPANLAYGETGAPPQIEPNSVLVFEVELHAIEEAAPAPAPVPAQ